MKSKSNRASRLHRAQGFSLVELMISLAIGLLLLTALATLFANSSRTQREVRLSAQQIENGRTAIDIVSEDVRHAGFWGYYGGSFSAPGAMPDPCALDAPSLTTAMALPVQGYNAPIATLPTCLPAANYLAGTDILVVRHVSSLPAGALSANGTYVQANATNTLVATGGGTFNLTARNGTGANVAAPIRAYETHIYFVSPCSVPAGATCVASDDGGSLRQPPGRRAARRRTGDACRVDALRRRGDRPLEYECPRRGQHAAAQERGNGRPERERAGAQHQRQLLFAGRRDHRRRL